MMLNFSMNFEPSFLVGLEVVSTRSYMMSVQTTCISATVFNSRYHYQLLFAMTLREGGGGPRHNVIMTLIF